MKRPHLPSLLAAAATTILASACASGGTPAPQDLSATPFAPALDINLATMRRTASGLYYEDLAIGTGDSAQVRKRVAVRYTGWLANGTKIDSADGLEFPLGTGRVIRGWDEGIAGMKVGGVRKLVIPPALGYGYREVGAIPPGSVLVFQIELLRVR